MLKILFWIGATLVLSICGLLVLSFSILGLSMGAMAIGQIDPTIWKVIGTVVLSCIIGYIIWGPYVIRLYESFFKEDI